ncbi:hypothetical protein [Streptomyces cavernicola]|uniref:Uncharacterized protein n=1 Tax=Streptomyces cavernicola TaxID=3043613 RepID=A0ABT6SKA1_9ACTN|nr:hypothetical protein [Streptomyces sp. B-S-A6]MDI3408334.1 hypothetical protein [Streptomyces sp. B-S-A6]
MREQRERTRYEDLVHRIYQDRRADPPARELLLAVAYSVSVADREEGRGPLKIAARVLGRDGIGRPRFDALVKADAPRYTPPREARDWGPSQAPGCRAPRTRPYVYRPRRTTATTNTGAVPLRQPPAPVLYVPPGYTQPADIRNMEMICGAPSHLRVLEKDLRTGWIRAHWFCKRHQDQADRVRDQVREQNEQAPEPVPNSGGLLPAYFKADWQTVYRRYAPRSWTPPPYGLSADDWPTPDGQTRPAKKGLRLIVTG